jgi:hypothetical protein
MHTYLPPPHTAVPVPCLSTVPRIKDLKWSQHWPNTAMRRDKEAVHIIYREILIRSSHKFDQINAQQGWHTCLCVRASPEPHLTCFRSHYPLGPDRLLYLTSNRSSFIQIKKYRPIHLCLWTLLQYFTINTVQHLQSTPRHTATPVLTLVRHFYVQRMSALVVQLHRHSKTCYTAAQ